MTAAVLDTGALIALERGDSRLWGVLAARAKAGGVVIVPTTALAQAWRNGSRQAQLARALVHCEMASFDALARAVGELCGRARTEDVCDAHVALVASRRADALYTSDPLDTRRLLRALDSDVAVIEC